VSTVADVAHKAGVSVSTAARVLSGNGYAAEGTRRVVLDAAAELGYVPNRIARSLRTRRTGLIGLLIGDVENSFYSAIAKNVELEAKAAGYHIVLCNSNDDPATEREYLRLLEGIQVEGLIVTPAARSVRHLSRLIQHGIVVVQVDRRIEGLQADAVLVDNEDAAARAVERVIAAGHRRIGILTGDLQVATARQRLAGYERAMRDHDLPIPDGLIQAGSFHRDHAIEHATMLIRSEASPTAIIAANNILAEACLLALADLGLRVPKDMSIVAFDDVEWMTMTSPPITAIRQPVADMARIAAERLLRRLRDDGLAAPTTIVLGTELRDRGSIARKRTHSTAPQT
jgi:LacI family transcriptional regulator